MSGVTQEGLKGKWRMKGDITYKNKRDFGGVPRWILVHNGLMIKHIFRAYGFLQTKYDCYDATTRSACIKEANRLGISITPPAEYDDGSFSTDFSDDFE